MQIIPQPVIAENKGILFHQYYEYFLVLMGKKGNVKILRSAFVSAYVQLLIISWKALSFIIMSEIIHRESWQGVFVVSGKFVFSNLNKKRMSSDVFGSIICKSPSQTALFFY